MKRLLLILTFLLAISSYAANQPAGLKVTNNGSSYSVEFQLPAYNMTEIGKDGENFVKLSIDGYGITSEAGYPELPQITFNLVVPANATEENITVSTNNISYSNINLSSKVYPFQAPWSKSEPLGKRPFNFNRAYYETEGRLNQPTIKISEPFVIGGVTGVMVTIYPFNYNPARNLLKAISNGSFTINLPQAIQKSTGHSESFDTYLKEIFTSFNPVNSGKGMNYLIITAPEYEATMQQFVNFKASNGYSVAMFTTATTGTTTAAIKSFIQTRYNDPNLKPEYILLVGDVDKIPYWVGTGEGTPSTDLNYGLLAGTDHFADAFVGRFSVTSTTELQNIINKTIYMTNNIGTLPKKNVFMASTDNSSITEGTHNYVINTYFAPNNYDNLKLYTVTYSATTQQVTNAVNDGKQFAIYSGHGGETSWADGPPYSQANVRALTNSIYPFVYSFACVTGSYQIAESFGETWIRIATGASSFYGSSVNSYWDEDDILERNLIKAMFDDDLTKVTPMMDKAKVYLVNHFGSLTATMKRYLEMYNLMGDPSLPTKRQILPDTTPPAPITNLSATGQTSNSITLNWTAPADTTFGGIASYDIRYSTSNIGDDAQFNNATSVIYGGNTDSAGTPKSYTVTGLTANTNYYFAVKARDIWVNTSTMSNVVSKSTFQAPVIAVNPTSLTCSLEPDVTQYDTVTISNINLSNSTLDYTVELKNNTFPTSAKVTATLIPVAKEKTAVLNERQLKEMENIEFGQAVKGNGGPDAFGYKWIDSDAPGGPQYVWNDISTTGTLVNNWTASGSYSATDEGYVGPLNLGFNFKFYGTVSTQIYVHSNGYITVGTQSATTFSNTTIPTSGTPNALIAPLWDDLDGGTSGKVYYKNDGNKFIIQFTNWPHYGSSSPGTYTFQVVLNQSGKIIFYYNNVSGTLNSCTVGIENPDGTIGLQVVKDAVYLKNNHAIQFMAEPDWLFMTTQSSGTLYNGNSANVQLKFQTDGLQNGTYGMEVHIASNDPVNPLIIVPVTMEVGDVVPVELTQFAASLENSYTKLLWSTATETNNQGYEIQRKTSADWENVGFVKGKGTTTEKNSYSFVDDLTNLKADKIYYRLKQIDFDGTAHYSQAVEVSFIPQQFSLDQNYPNPFNPSTTIKFALPKTSNVKLIVFNTLGQVVSELVNEKLDAGYHSFDFNASNLSSGVYYYRLETENFVSVKKMMLIK